MTYAPLAHSPGTRPGRGRSDRHVPARNAMHLSVVVPALDEAAIVAEALDALAPLRAAGHEVVVVDGGSADATVELASPRADRVIVAPRGRAAQMNAGAAVARGSVFVFLHADTRLPDGAADAIAYALGRGARWGRFDVKIDGRSRWVPVVARLMNVRSRLTGIATGDQAIFVTRAAFAQAGGFPVQPLMEDVALSATLKRVAGAPACLRQRVVTSGRRWDERGALATMATMWRLRFDNARGVDPAALAARYRASSPSRPAPTLAIFAKEPVPGRVKTRLASAIGDDAAAAVYREIAERTLRAAVAARAAGAVGRIELWCDPDADRPAFTAWRDRFGLALDVQRGADLGARMRHAVAGALARGMPALVIGTDCPALDEGYLARAAAALTRHDVVVGPAEDGGYVMLGLARDVDVFSDMPWSSPALMGVTRARIAALRASFVELPALWDVDTAADLARYRAMSHRPDAAVPRG